MSNDPRAFVTSFEEKFMKMSGKPRMEMLIHFRPREFHFYMLIVTELGGRYRPEAPFGDMIRAFPLDHWEETVMDLLKKFVKKREKSPRITGIENGISFIEAVCREFPEFFADNLDDLFVAGITFPGHYTAYMWQRFGAQYGTFLKLYTETNSDDFGEQCRALSYALVTGDRELERWAKDFIRHQMDISRKFIEGLDLQGELLNKNLMEMGLEWRGNDVRQLHTANAYHLTFPYRYLHMDMDKESFYKTSPLPKPNTFGGAMQATNKAGKRSKVQHFLTLDPVPSFLPINGLSRLYIACDLDLALLTEGATYQKHHPNGSVVILDDERKAYPEGKPHLEQAIPFVKSTKIVLSDQGKAFTYQRYGRGENYYRLGGPPIFISTPKYPACKECKRTMVFILQLDSTLPRSDGQPLEWGVDGMAYFYWCDHCKISAVNYDSE